MFKANENVILKANENIYSLMASLGYVGGRESRDVGAASPLGTMAAIFMSAVPLPRKGGRGRLKSGSCRKRACEGTSKTVSFTGTSVLPVTAPVRGGPSSACGRRNSFTISLIRALMKRKPKRC